MTEGDGDVPEVLTSDDLDRIPPDLREKLSEFSVTHAFSMIQSPLLPPAMLKEYDDVVPGLAERLVSWTEAESNHRRALEIEGFNEVKGLRGRGQIFGVVTSLAGLLIAGVLGYAGARYESSAATVLGGIVAIVAVGGPFAARILAGRFGRNSPEE